MRTTRQMCACFFLVPVLVRFLCATSFARLWISGDALSRLAKKWNVSARFRSERFFDPSRCVCEDGVITSIQSRSITDSEEISRCSLNDLIIQIQPRSTADSEAQESSPISHTVQVQSRSATLIHKPTQAINRCKVLYVPVVGQ